MFPAQLTWVPSRDADIRGTDGKNIGLLMNQTKSVVEIAGSEHDSTWLKFINIALREGVTCIIDAGAILVGKSIRD